MTYKVKKGDTLSSIAKAHNISLDELLTLNGISKDKANSINVGQELKISQPSPSTETPGFRTPAFNTQFTMGMDWQSTPKPEDSDMGVPYVSGYTKQDFAADHAKTIQEQLLAAGYNIGSTGADGKWGKNSQAALDRALAEGYTLKGGQLVKPTLKSRKTATTPQTASTGIDPKYLKSNALSIQQQLKEFGYDLGTSGKNKDGVDGSWGGKSQTALDRALADGYTFKDGKLVAPVKKETVHTQFVPYGYSPGLVRRTQGGVSESEQNDVEDSFERSLTPRQYTAAQNTVADLIGAPLRRGISYVIGPELTNKILPTREFNENHLSPELYAWLQDAVDRKWSPEERIRYFETNPTGEVTKGWKGRIAGTKAKESDYRKYYSEDYTGPMKKGATATMFGSGIDQAQGTLGSFNLIYTKDGVYVVDDWDFGTGQKFDTSSLMGVVRQAEESYGSQENDNLSPTRSIKAFIRYKK
jgi:murein DD-endopeptidase MepM/ murein hydrolase activator NlpD